MISIVLAAVLSGPIPAALPRIAPSCTMSQASCDRLRQLLSEVEIVGTWDPRKLAPPLQFPIEWPSPAQYGTYPTEHPYDGSQY